MDRKQEFLNWCIYEGGTKPTTANEYISYLNNVSQLLFFKKHFSIRFFYCGVEDIEKLKKAYNYFNEIIETKDFSGISHPERLGNYKSAINKYISFINAPKITKDISYSLNQKTEANVQIDYNLLVSLFEVYCEQLFPGYKKSNAIKSGTFNAQYFENDNSFLIVILEPKNVSMENYETIIKAITNASYIIKKKEIEGIIICASENQEILPNIQKIYSSEIINKIKIRKYCIKLTLE
jgi:hypothetical protein